MVDATGDQDTTTMKRKKSCVVHLAKLAMLGKNIRAQEEETDVKMTDAELEEDEKKGVFQSVVDFRD